MIKLKGLIFEGLTERNTYVASSKIAGAGKGLFAARDFKPHDLILTAKIRKIPNDQWQSLVTNAPELIKRYGYSWGGAHMGVPGRWWPGFRLNPTAKKAIAKTIFAQGFHEFNFINDNQINPNVSENLALRWEIQVFAKRNIKKGEELTKAYPSHGTATYTNKNPDGSPTEFNWWR